MGDQKRPVRLGSARPGSPPPATQARRGGERPWCFDVAYRTDGVAPSEYHLGEEPEDAHLLVDRVRLAICSAAHGSPLQIAPAELPGPVPVAVAKVAGRLQLLVPIHEDGVRSGEVRKEGRVYRKARAVDLPVVASCSRCGQQHQVHPGTFADR